MVTSERAGICLTNYMDVVADDCGRCRSKRGTGSSPASSAVPFVSEDSTSLHQPKTEETFNAYPCRTSRSSGDQEMKRANGKVPCLLTCKTQ